MSKLSYRFGTAAQDAPGRYQGSTRAFAGATLSQRAGRDTGSAGLAEAGLVADDCRAAPGRGRGADVTAAAAASATRA